MNSLFGGLVLILLDYDVTLGSAQIGLLPDFLGFFLMMKGMEALARKHTAFDRGRHVAFGLAILSGVLYVGDLMSPSGMLRVFFWGLELAGMILALLLVRMVISGLTWLEKDLALDLHSGLLKNIWLILVVFQILAHLLGWMVLVGEFALLGATVIGGLFLLIFWDSRKNFGKT